MGIPPQMVDMLWPQLSMQIMQVTGGMNLSEMRPIDHCPKRMVPALFIHGIEDDLIPMDHSARNFEAYGCSEKDVCYCEGDHNSRRPNEVL